MKSADKVKYIQEMVEKINNELLKNKAWKIRFDNQLGANNYCLLVDKEMFSFNTYDGAISCLRFMIEIFSRATRERKDKEK